MVTDRLNKAQLAHGLRHQQVDISRLRIKARGQQRAQNEGFCYQFHSDPAQNFTACLTGASLPLATSGGCRWE